MEISRNKLTAREHVAAVAVQQTNISSEKHPSFEGQFCFMLVKKLLHVCLVADTMMTLYAIL